MAAMLTTLLSTSAKFQIVDAVVVLLGNATLRSMNITTSWPSVSAIATIPIDHASPEAVFAFIVASILLAFSPERKSGNEPSSGGEQL